MKNHLNNINPERARPTIDRNAKSHSIRLAAYQKTSAGNYEGLSEHAWWLAEIALENGALKHLLSDVASEVALSLRAAAQWHAASFEARLNGALQHSSVWTLHLGRVGLVTAFGTREQRAVVGRAPAAACVGDKEVDSASARTALLWQEFLVSGQLAERAALAVLTDSEAENADRWDRQWTHGIVRALLAVARRDADELNTGLGEVLVFHRYLATRGGWELLTDGLLSLVALGLMRLGMEAGLALTVSSDYAPVALLTVERQ